MQQWKLIYLLAVVSMVAWGCDANDDNLRDEGTAATAGQLPPQSANDELDQTPDSMAESDLAQTDESGEADENGEALNESANDEPSDAPAPVADGDGDEQVGDSDDTDEDTETSTEEGAVGDPSPGGDNQESDGDPSEEGTEQTDQQGSDDAEGAGSSEPSEGNPEVSNEAVPEGTDSGDENDSNPEEMTSDEGAGTNSEDENAQDADGGEPAMDEDTPNPSTTEPEEGTDSGITDEGSDGESDFGVDRSIYPEGPYFPETEIVSDLQFEAVGESFVNLSAVRSDPNNRVLVVYTGVAWCGSCRVHMAQYGDMLERLQDRGLSVMSVVRENYSGGIADGNFAAAYAARNGFTHGVFADPNDALAPFIEAVQAQQPGAFRISMIIDVGTMSLLHIGQIAPYTAEQLIEPLLAP